MVVPEGVAPPRAIVAMAINPRVGRPWILGLHQCSSARRWNTEEERLFVEIGHRLADALSALLAYRDVRESEQKLAQAQRVARLGYWERDVETFAVNYSEETYRIFGLSPELLTLEPARLAERLHPEDRHIMLEAYESAIAGGPRYDVDYRVRLPDGVVRYVHSEADVTRDADGRPLRMFGTMQDITDRKELTREQEALRRVATLVARATSPEEILASVTAEAGRLLGVDLTALVRSDADADAETVIAGWSASGPFDGLGRTTRFGELAQSLGIRAAVGVPIAVEGEIRGTMYAASTTGRPLRPDTEERLARFTDLLATAYANAGAREQLRRVADEQAALRRVATLVARGVDPERLLAAVAEEAGRVLTSAEMSIIGRYTADHAIEFVGGWGRTGDPVWVGQTASLGGDNVSTLVYETAEPARVDHLDDEAAPVTAIARGSRARSSAGAPIEVEGRLWGVIIVASSRDEGLPAGIEHELAAFTELVATAIANTQAREELAASRARLVAAADETRRRIVRDLHDGAQNRLVQTIMTLTLAQHAQDRHDGETARMLFDEALGHAEQANVELRELAQGILPSVLARGGLAASVEELVERLRLPVTIEVTPDRFAPEIEANAYFVVAEALTNLAKHSRAGSATVAGWVEGNHLHVDVSDDGVGGARPEGSGLRGLADRVAALGGRMMIDSPSGGGTRILADLPLDQQRAFLLRTRSSIASESAALVRQPDVERW